jgi:hypothetical protein
VVDRRLVGRNPGKFLTRAGFTQFAEAMDGRSQYAVEIREGVYATARAAAACLCGRTISTCTVAGKLGSCSHCTTTTGGAIWKLATLLAPQ